MLAVVHWPPVLLVFHFNFHMYTNGTAFLQKNLFPGIPQTDSFIYVKLHFHIFICYMRFLISLMHLCSRHSQTSVKLNCLTPSCWCCKPLLFVRLSVILTYLSKMLKNMPQKESTSYTSYMKSAF